jgi:hypothetical protein
MTTPITLADFGTCIDALDRPAGDPSVVTLGHANNIPDHGWYVHVHVDDRAHAEPGLTKQQAKDLLREWAQQPAAPAPDASDPSIP